MTERLYYTSDNTEGQANLLSCSAEPDGRYAVVLDRTLFHPQGGGQPADAGWIDGERVETVLARGDDVVHIVAKPLLPGIVNLRVDVALRQLHARLHSAGHLIGLAGTAFGWLPVKAHHWPNEGRITFAAGENGTLPDTLSLQEKINAWQADNLARQVTFTDGLRQVGFGHLLAYPCGGTHVAHLSEIGPVTITQVKMKKGQMIVNYTLVP
ncbi:alanyl-tRNA editing protein [Citrobacter portucalensis]|jgi:alanyl-tRNA synthetase|uniref:alanyl-tRNA editing protein n=1 Tax=Citrobacter TaxID=544 RepID=UPI0019502C1E|nr:MULTISPECIES: alanyl-tRNA editing protein [Citrobacter]MBJ9212739.1 alanyl-tRNA editing protein [Citrobacter freundii]MBM6610842.1 alanyl-tRNA editing protein [Citrobacter portucalensis]MDM2809947.1 alanyl-tRNA editing protein [Citrobacter sp. Cpo107]URR12273.1 alanyl-tRNA editing protein [Citrobacter portucalensis]